jgi:hypothetical protein
VTAAQVEEKFGKDARQNLKRLADSGRLRRLSRGLYTSVTSVTSSHSQVGDGERGDTVTPPSESEEDL